MGRNFLICFFWVMGSFLGGQGFVRGSRDFSLPCRKGFVGKGDVFIGILGTIVDSIENIESIDSTNSSSSSCRLVIMVDS